MISGILALLAANLGVACGAAALTRRLSTGIPSLDVVVFLLLRLLLISATVAAAGWTGLLRPAVLGAAGLAVFCAVLARAGGWTRPRWRCPDAHPLLLALLACVAVRLLLQIWFFSPHLGDAVAYHLPKIAEWVRYGGFTREMGIHPHVTFPAGFELVETWWVVFLHHDVLIEAAGVEFLVLGFASVFALALHVGLPEKGAWVAATAFALSPGLHLSATSCLNDTAAAALVTAATALVAWRASWRLVLIAAGLGLGVKATTLYAMGGIALLAVLVRREPRRPHPSPGLGLSLGVGAICLGASWFVRNYLWFGNPVFPVGTPGYSSSPVAVQSGPRWASFAANAVDLLSFRMYDRQAALGANVDDMAGWGACAFAVGLLALPLVMRDNPRFRALAIAFLSSLACGLALIIHDPWCMKYLFYAPALLSIGAAALAVSNPMIRLILGFALALNLLATTLPYDLPLQEFRALARQPWKTRSALRLFGPPLPPGPVACFGKFEIPAYLLYGPDFARSIVYPRAISGTQLIDAMRAAGADVLYAKPLDLPSSRVVEECVARGDLIAAGSGVFTLAPARSAPAER